ncbi:MAG: hypothetical protein H7A46_08595 [Verrucomicrobiales bacterium]|nr:hypothetical protein [Verrucomicrobiales bacterium]
MRFGDAPVVRGVADASGNTLPAGWVNGSVEVAVLPPPTFTVVPLTRPFRRVPTRCSPPPPKVPPPLAWQWFHDDVPQPGANGPRLVLRDLSTPDAGTWRVAVSAGPGRVSEREMTLTVMPDLRSGLVGQWDFAEGDLLAGVGLDLEYRGDTESVTSFGEVEFGGQSAAVMTFPGPPRPRATACFPPRMATPAGPGSTATPW